VDTNGGAADWISLLLDFPERADSTDAGNGE
jgi:hypothetical protein